MAPHISPFKGVMHNIRKPMKRTFHLPYPSYIPFHVKDEGAIVRSPPPEVMAQLAGWLTVFTHPFFPETHPLEIDQAFNNNPVLLLHPVPRV